MKITRICLLLILSLSAAFGEPVGSTDITADLPFPIRTGKVFRIVFVGPVHDYRGVEVFVPSSGPFAGNSILLTDSIAGISSFIASELQRGIPTDFLHKTLPGLLCLNFAGPSARGLWSDAKLGEAKRSIQELASFLDSKEYAIMDRIVERPHVGAEGNAWVIRYTSFGPEGEIGIVLYRGHIMPFSVESRHEFALAPKGFALTSSEEERQRSFAQVIKIIESALESCETLESDWLRRSRYTKG